MKILTICSAGACRSVAMAHVLKGDYGHDAVPVGRDANSQKTLDMLSEWADKIIVMQPKYAIGTLKASLHKLIPAELTDVGPDVWRNPLSPQLRDIVGTMAENLHRKGLLRKG
jgi:hypothetical protein